MPKRTWEDAQHHLSVDKWKIKPQQAKGSINGASLFYGILIINKNSTEEPQKSMLIPRRQAENNFHLHEIRKSKPDI